MFLKVGRGQLVCLQTAQHPPAPTHKCVYQGRNILLLPPGEGVAL